jgi:poly(3-hydroxybutyrate) depolymerase
MPAPRSWRSTAAPTPSRPTTARSPVAGSVPRYTARRAKRNGCDSRPRTTRPRPRVERFVYRGCDAGLRVELLRLAGTDHGWPGAGPPLPDRNPSGVNATTELLRFLAGARDAS